MNQGGKHVADPGRLENKRERRRVGAGRAAVLRRAPSDSDCSGETASLSADSGDRAPRPAPLAPPRSGKTRSRRRGSEWEVLEGLKDGQRFEKRPDVFNGYLHKKRKWPLKGWHKRFFVIDGGILVYARSPTDVARGRLHGSVDVGLSVISAKARRRRIDIDADEFIYHLRAKTPEVFRTWLNVLKAHRLYRQHLLTFGARESVPKIHPPLEDLPATDTSSHSSLISESSTETSIRVENPDSPRSPIPEMPINVESSEYSQIEQNSIHNWQQDTLSKSSLIPLNFESLEEKEFDLKLDDTLHTHKSLCSMHCVEKRYMNELKRKKSPDNSLNTTDAEKQITYTDLELNSLKNVKQLDPSVIDNVNSTRSNCHNDRNSGLTKQSIMLKENNYCICRNEMPVRKRSPFLKNKLPSTTTCFFFTRKKHDVNTELMRKSKKCTNLVKYKNLSDEPPLKMQSSKCMLLNNKYKLTTKHVLNEKAKRSHRAVACDAVRKDIVNNEVQVKIENKQNKASITTTTDYDEITEKLMVSIFQKNDKGEKDVKYYIDQVIKDLYDVKVNQGMHPVKALFRNLLEYWLKNTSIASFKEAMTNDKSLDRQSNKYFTKDKNLSSFVLGTKSKATQFHGLSDVIAQYKLNKNANTIKQKGKDTKCEVKILPNCPSPRRDTESFEKERRIQELERLLRSTVYVCETARNNTNKEKDIKITKKLINNLSKLSRYNDFSTSDEKPGVEKSSSSAEIPEMQDTINHLISETCIPPDIAKEFFGAYLDVLLQNSSKSTTTSQSSEWEKQSQENLACEVVAESVVKKVSKSITTLNIVNDDRKENVPMVNNKSDTEKQIDPGQVYLRDILDKVTTIFSKVKKVKDDNTWHHGKFKEDPKHVDSKVQKTIKDELGRPVFKHSQKNLVYENCDENSLVIDLCKYNLEHISMFNDPELQGIMSITIKLKEKPPNHGESKQTNLNLKFADDTKPVVTNMEESNKWLPYVNPNDSTSNEIFDKLPETNIFTCVSVEAKRDVASLKPFLSNSDGTSNARRPLNASYYSLEKPATNNPKDAIVNKTQSEDPQSCYIMSFKTGALASKFLSKKNKSVKECDCESAIIKPKDYSPSTSSAANKPTTELSAIDKTAPRIIDETFVLLLLENLTFLSRNVPALHKDINTLYVKLRKRHEKMVKYCNHIQGLSLLGKIYSEDPSSKDGDDRGTQFDPNVNKDTNRTQDGVKDASTNTNINKVDEKCVCTYTPAKKLINSKVQTVELIDVIKEITLNPIENSYKPNRNGTTEVTLISTLKCNRDCMAVAETETIDIDSADQATCYPNAYKVTTEDCALTTCVEYIIGAGSSYISPKTLTRNKFERDSFKNKRHSLTARQQLFKELSLLSSSVKVSTQSQTDRLFLRSEMEKRFDKDYDVYQLYLSKKCGVKASSSMSILSSVLIETSDDLKTLYRCSSEPSNCSGLLSPTTPTIRGPQAGFVSGTPGGRLAGWIIESGGPLETASRELGQAQLSVQQLQRLLDALELQHQVHHDTDVSLEGASPNVKKDRRKFGLRKKKSNSKCASVELAPPHIDPSTSHTALSTLSALTAPPSPGGGASSMPSSAASLPIACAAARPQSLPGAESLNTATGPASLTSLTPDHQLREDFTVLAKDLVTNLKSIVSGLVCERGRLRAALEAAESTASPGGAMVAALRTNLNSALQQNSELRTRLSRIHDTSDIAEIISVANSDAVNRQFQQSLSYSSSCVSASEFFDAEEHDDDEDDKHEDVIPADETGVIELDGDSSSEAGSLTSEEGSASSDNSDGAMLSAEQVTLRHNTNGSPRPASCWTRRTRLPAPRPSPGGPSLWNLLYKNIGKDLSQISMPVTINEPLNMLQRLCEELEYSELLDSAAECKNSVERMCLIAAFAVSAYAASAHRAASKPFNPLLAETYECVRDDRGFRFLAEQVSHHPPISACHAESGRWCFWQEARIKTKFWGKSMEFQPTGRVHVRLNTTGDHYTWNKVTTCVHNLFGGQRWVDQYGDMHIVCLGTDISCKLNFVKASSWSATRHEVRGAVTASSSGTRVRLAGRWSEALYAGEPPANRCLWRPGAMPPEHELYYGFTRFAMELNEMEPGMRDLLPHTDTRFRPDQRALEEGDVDAAEAFKHELEQAQRDRRRESPTHAAAWFRKTVEDGEETWVFSGEYWKAREAGFSDDVAPRIW